MKITIKKITFKHQIISRKSPALKSRVKIINPFNSAKNLKLAHQSPVKKLLAINVSFSGVRTE